MVLLVMQRLHGDSGAAKIELNAEEAVEMHYFVEGTDVAQGVRYPSHLNSVPSGDTLALEGWVPLVYVGPVSRRCSVV